MFIVKQLCAHTMLDMGAPTGHIKNMVIVTHLEIWRLGLLTGVYLTSKEAFAFSFYWNACSNHQKSSKCSYEAYRMIYSPFTGLSFGAKFYNNLTFI